jgi:hypothetical protein
MPATPAVAHARARVMSLKKHHPQGGETVDAAVTDLRELVLEQHIRKAVDAAPPLTDQQKARLAALLRPSDGGSNAA